MTALEEIDDATFDEIATEAARTVKTAPRLGRRLAPMLAELDAALPRHIEVGDDVRTELDRYERDTAVRERIGAELQTLFALPGGPLWHDHPPFVLTQPTHHPHLQTSTLRSLINLGYAALGPGMARAGPLGEFCARPESAGRKRGGCPVGLSCCLWTPSSLNAHA